MVERPTVDQIKDAVAIIVQHIRSVEAQLQSVVAEMEAAQARYRQLDTEKASLERRLEKLRKLQIDLLRVVEGELGIDASVLLQEVSNSQMSRV